MVLLRCVLGRVGLGWVAAQGPACKVPGSAASAPPTTSHLNPQPPARSGNPHSHTQTNCLLSPSPTAFPLQGETCEVFTVTVRNDPATSAPRTIAEVCQQDIQIVNGNGDGECT